jgi:hypothetical protein
MHFDPTTGEDRSASETAPGEEPCVRACYDCLLSYRNQSLHQVIDRHLVRDLMLRLAAASVRRESTATEEAGRQSRQVTDHEPPLATAVPSNPRAAQFVAWLRSRGLRLPDAVDLAAEGTRPDLIYRLPDGNAAVFVAGTGEDGPAHNDSAYEALRDLGWGVIIIGADADWEAVAARYPSVFGSHRHD